MLRHSRVEGGTQERGGVVALAMRLALIAAIALLPEIARAQSGTCGTVAGFEIDGDLVPSGGDDWADSCGNVVGHAIFLGPARTPNPALSDPAFSLRDPDWAGHHADPTTFAGGNRNNDYIGIGQRPWTTSSGSGAQKTDLVDVYLTTRISFEIGPPATTNLWLILGGTTRAANGDAHIDFEFNRAGITENPGVLVGNGPAAGRSIGDVTVSVDYGVGGANPRISLRRWQETTPGVFGWVDVTPTLAGNAFLCVNTAPGVSTGPWGGIAPDGSTIPPCGTMAPLQFFEGAVSLQLLGVPDPGLDPCSPLSTVIVKTRSTDSFNSELRDYALQTVSPTVAIEGPSVVCAAPPDQLNRATRGPIISLYDAKSSFGSSFEWSISGDGSIVGSTTESSVQVAHGKSGSFRLIVTVKDPNGTCVGATNKVVAVTPAPGLTVPDVTSCSTAESTLCAVVSAGTPPFTYLWDTGETTPCIAAAGTHTVTVTDSKGCDSTATGTKTVNPSTTCAITGPDQICKGGSAQLCGPPGMASYLWSTKATTQCITVDKIGTYSITITDSTGCQTQCSRDLMACPKSLTSETASIQSGTEPAPRELPAQPTPNPFRSSMSIPYSVHGPSSERVEITIYDIHGRLVRTLVSRVQSVGRFDASWDGRNDKGLRMPSGVYLLLRRVGDERAIHRIVFMR